ncbi:MAG: hypothetical protein ROO76_05620 [Terriglobia bacterium]|jgi:hypothetical protein|nr:hypothetical protein [Terriglobia bacterium]
MKNVTLYDPRRCPKHWVELLHAGQFAVLLLDVRTSVNVNCEGLPVPQPAEQSCYIFESLDEAKQFCRELVQRIEHVRCEIYDERGKAIEPLYTIVNKKHEHRTITRKGARLLLLGGVLAPMVAIPLFWYDWLAGGERIWPTIVGINLVVLGLRLLFWGSGELEQSRRQEAEQTRVEGLAKTSRGTNN